MDDPASAAIGIGDDDEPEAALDEQRYDVPNENIFVDRGHASMECPARWCQSRRNALLWRRAPNATAVPEPTFADGDTRRTCPADLERHGMKADVAENTESVTMRAIDPDRFRQENWMMPHRAPSSIHAQLAMHQPRQRMIASNPLSLPPDSNCSNEFVGLQKVRFERTVCAAARTPP